MNASQTLGALAAALAKARAGFPAIPKNKTATVPTKSGGTYKYDYADLADILDAVTPHLSANGLALVQPTATNGKVVTVRTRLLHASGEWLEEELSLTAADDRPQSIGAACTYARRYGAAGMLSVAPDADVDGEVQETAPRQRHTAPPPRPAPKPDPAPAPAALDPGMDPPAMEHHAPPDPEVVKVVRARANRLIKRGLVTSDNFLAESSRILERSIPGLSSLSREDMTRIEEALIPADAGEAA